MLIALLSMSFLGALVGTAVVAGFGAPLWLAVAAYPVAGTLALMLSSMIVHIRGPLRLQNLPEGHTEHGGHTGADGSGLSESPHVWRSQNAQTDTSRHGLS